MVPSATPACRATGPDYYPVLDPSFPQQQRLPAGGVFEVRAFGAEGPAEGVVGVRGFGGVAVVEQDGEFQRAAALPFAVGEVFQGERDFRRDRKIWDRKREEEEILKFFSL